MVNHYSGDWDIKVVVDKLRFVMNGYSVLISDR